MKEMTLQNITRVCNGEYKGDVGLLNKEVTSITIDSRKIEDGCLFVALKGVRVDGHDFIHGCMAKDALCGLSEQYLGEVDFPYILVNSSHQALKDMAKFYREVLDVKVVGITGSVGKTSTKEMIASVLSRKYNVLKTDGNFNNEIGLPLTIFNLREDHEVAVLEMGISTFGEMSRLTDVAQPDVAVITNIGCCHLETLDNLDGVLRAKSEIFESMGEDDCVILNGMDEQLRKIQEVHGITPLFFGINGGYSVNPQDADDCDLPFVHPIDVSFAISADHVKNLGLKGTRCSIHLGDEVITPTISIPGEHMVLNAMAGAMVGMKLGLSATDICTGIEALVPVSGRNHILWGARYTVIDDCYNANPVSMKASLDVLATANTRKVAILGDMGELGVEELEMHREVGAYAGSLGLDVIVCIGSLARHMADGALEAIGGLNGHGSLVIHYDSKEAFLEDYEALILEGDTVLVKSSNFMKFHELVDILSV